MEVRIHLPKGLTLGYVRPPLFDTVSSLEPWNSLRDEGFQRPEVVDFGRASSPLEEYQHVSMNYLGWIMLP